MKYTFLNYIYISYSKDYLLIFNANVIDVHEIPYKVKFYGESNFGIISMAFQLANNVYR